MAPDDKGRAKRSGAPTLGLAVVVALLVVGCGRIELGADDAGLLHDASPRPLCADDGECDDGDPCNGAERCREGLCEPGLPVVCDDGVACTADVCDSSSGACLSLPDHELCGIGELCDPSRGCLGRPCGSSEECDDGHFCNGAEFCESGHCVPGSPPDCGDGLACTRERCDVPTNSCVSEADHGVCDDGLFCNGAERCDLALGCLPGRPVLCDDGLECTLDGCDEASGACVHEPLDADRDGYPDCACAREPCDCDDRDVTVNPGMTEQCRDLRDNDCDGLVDCEDRSECGADPRCDLPCSSAEECDDGLYCNGAELCVEGACRPGAPPACADDVACTRDRCDEALESCVTTPDHSRCEAGELCDSELGCVPTSCVDDSDCDDGLFCNGAERCLSDGTCGAGERPRCADGVRCTVNRCDEAVDGCVFVPRDARCDDGLFCNGEERCDPAAGGCVAGDDPCGEGGPCETVLCDELTRACASSRRDDDGDGYPPESCGGGDCDDLSPRVNPGARELCDDGRDNDCDGATDCADPACASVPLCCVPTGAERCGDGLDNDCDGRTDCSDVLDCRLDPACSGCTAELCWDAVDNDCDGDVDCDDGDCADAPSCGAPDTCTDARNVGDGGTFLGSTAGLANDYWPELGEPGCAGGRGPEAVYYLVVEEPALLHVDTFGSAYDTVLYVRAGHCTAGPQVACNDDTVELQSQVDLVVEPGFYFVFVDGYSERSAGDYVLHVLVTTRGDEICDNGVDDDGDGLVDCDDAECAPAPWCVAEPERGVAGCTDGLDNDGDGLVDCDDTEDCAVISLTGECCNGVDDNFNGYADEFACACDAAASCAVGVCYTESAGACGPRCTALGGDRFCEWVFPETPRCSVMLGHCVY